MRLASDLRVAVLQAAFQGKITLQDAQNESGGAALELLRSNKKTALIKAKAKGVTPQFAIPKNWVWCFLGECIELLSGADFETSLYNSVCAGIPYMTGASNIQNGLLVVNRWTESPKCVSHRGDLLLVCKGAGYGKTVFNNIGDIHIARQFMAISGGEALNLHYVKYYLDLFFNCNRPKGKGLIPGIDRNMVLFMPFPLAPIEEQNRIVDRINELMPAINEYEEMENRLVALKEAFPGNLRESILFSAIQGKLTQQYDSDEPVANLKKRLSDRKTATGVISKKDKLPMFHPTFDIPESWTWTTLSRLGTLSGGKTPSMQDAENWASPDVNWFTSKDMKQKYLSESLMKISLKASEELQLFPSGTLLMVVRSGILKHTLPLCVLTQEATINQDLKAFTLFDNEMSEYVYWMLKGLQPEIITRYTKHVTTVDSLKMDEFFYQMPVPLPPIEEQRRIVERLNTILPLCDALAEDI